MRSALCFILASLLLSACSTINYVGIEAYKPAEITFPGGVRKVLVVNNAVPQRPDSGYEFSLLGLRQDTARASADSALFDACRSLGEFIVETDYFQDVLLYHDAIREDNSYLSDARLDMEAIRLLCEANGADAVISLDRLLFNMNKNVIALPEGILLGTILVKMGGVIRTYLPDRENALATVLISDSLYWEEAGMDMRQLDSFLPQPDEALRTAGKFIGEIAYPNFVPHWRNEIRWYFSKGTSAWRTAAAYATSERWDLAEELWRTIHEQTNNGSSKAKSASNIALSLEMKGKIEEAYEWAEKSLALFEKSEKKESRDYQLLSQYVLTLKERVLEDRKLNVQFGGE